MVTVRIWREAMTRAIRKGSPVPISPPISSAVIMVAMDCTVPLKKAVP